jgi:hypothetical protein
MPNWMDMQNMKNMQNMQNIGYVKHFKTSVYGGILQYVLVFSKVYRSTFRIPYTWTVQYGSVCTNDYDSIGFRPMEESGHGQWTKQNILSCPQDMPSCT